MPVDQPISLNVGHTQSPDFSVNVQENFELQLAVDRSVPSDLAVHVLGIGDATSAHDELARGFRVKWAVEQAGTVIKTGISDGHDQGYWGATEGRRFGFFRAEKEKPYTIRLDVLEDGSKLAPYHPRLQVRVDLFALDGYFLSTGVMVAAGVFAAGLGAILLIVAGVLRLKSKGQRAVAA
jgi:hypothetical protein